MYRQCQNKCNKQQYDQMQQNCEGLSPNKQNTPPVTASCEAAWSKPKTETHTNFHNHHNHRDVSYLSLIHIACSCTTLDSVTYTKA